MTLTTRERFNWRQNTPFDQLTAILAGFEGKVMNAEEADRESSLNTASFLKDCAMYIEQLRALSPYLSTNNWTK